MTVVLVSLVALVVAIEACYFDKGFHCPTCPNQFKCPGNECIPIEAVNDGNDTCHDFHYSYGDEGSSFKCRVSMGRTQTLVCRGTSICYNSGKRCNGVSDCPFGDDEEDCNPCSGGRNCIADTCEEVQNPCQSNPNCTQYLSISGCCSDNSILCSEISLIHSDISFKCHDYQCLPSDSCEKPITEGCFDYCVDGLICSLSGKCIEKNQMCNGEVECTSTFFDDMDEKLCCDENSYFQCFDSKCIHYSLLCNGINDCASGEDEAWKVGCSYFPLQCLEPTFYSIEYQAYLNTNQLQSLITYFIRSLNQRLYSSRQVCYNRNWETMLLNNIASEQYLSQTSYTAIKMINIIVATISILFGPLANLMIFILTLQHIVTDKNLNFLFINLASISDFITSFVRSIIQLIEFLKPVLIFKSIVYTSHGVSFDPPDFVIWCRIVNIIRVFSQYLSPWINVVIAYERFVIMNYTTSSSILTFRRRIVVMIFLLLFTFTLSTWFAVFAHWNFMAYEKRYIIHDLNAQCHFGIFRSYVDAGQYTGLHIFPGGINMFSELANNLIEMLLTVLLPVILQVIFYLVTMVKSKRKVQTKSAKLQLYITKICLAANIVFLVMSFPLILQKTLKFIHAYKVLHQLYKARYGNDFYNTWYIVHIENGGLYWEKYSGEFYTIPWNDLLRFICRMSECIYNFTSVVNPIVFMFLFKGFIKRRLMQLCKR